MRSNAFDFAHEVCDELNMLKHSSCCSLPPVAAEAHLHEQVPTHCKDGAQRSVILDVV